MPPTADAPELPAPPDAAWRGRLALIGRLFRLCDQDGDRHLNCDEMRLLARHTGFNGSDSEWADEFFHLCEVHESHSGVTETLLKALLNDRTGDGYFCTDAELKSACNKLQDASDARLPG